MPGHIQQRGPSSWRLHAFVGKDTNGRKRYASKTFHGTKKEAGIALAAFVTEVAKDRNASSVAESITVSQTLDKWLDSRRAQLSLATTDRYRVAIKHIEPVLGSMRVARLRPHHIEDLYSGSWRRVNPVRRFGRSIGHYASRWLGRTDAAIHRSSPPRGSSYCPSGPRRLNPLPPTTSGRSSIICWARTPAGERWWPSLPGQDAVAGRSPVFAGRTSISLRGTS